MKQDIPQGKKKWKNTYETRYTTYRTTGKAPPARITKYIRMNEIEEKTKSEWERERKKGRRKKKEIYEY